ncbi:MAG: biotin/lipoyl-binding protein [Candidatus Cloacimonetes bacterium]|nr:biotin/lipoyl-binding protein [Candidatus Cloacimonadota bacterium]
MKTYKMNINGEKYTTKIKEYKGSEVIVEVNGIDFLVEIETEKRKEIQLVRSPKTKPQTKISNPRSTKIASASSLTAPIPGTIISINVNIGDDVQEGDTVLILEAMKMETEIAAPKSGKIKEIFVKEGAPVMEGEALLDIEE